MFKLNLINLELRLARAHWTNVESRDAVKTYNKVALRDLPKRMEQLVQNLRAAFKDGIDTLEWMTPETRRQAQEKLARTNPHSPEMYRANGPVRNVPEFYSAFGVRPGDKMFLEPEKRTKIW